jgi:hypothetical protein
MFRTGVSKKLNALQLLGIRYRAMEFALQKNASGPRVGVSTIIGDAKDIEQYLKIGTLGDKENASATT